ncbi:hypothetical protein [Actinophytocola glycyrrhizae]|uniref:Uncharacterized protein n=1 Tax=Actinophytocola glycyrrhizae TaxID=2044873 RepID=A0ABV9RVD2_9PSEU
MDRDPGSNGSRGPLLGGFVVSVAVLSVVSLDAMVRSPAPMTHPGLRTEVGPFSRAVSQVFSGDGREEFATSAIVLAAGPAATSPTTRLRHVFPGMAIPGMLDGRGVSGPVRRTLFVLEVPTMMALAVSLLRVTVGTARERGTPARAEVAG